MDSSVSDVYIVTLREQLASTFNLGELKTLCFDLQIPYDDLPGDRLDDKTRELVLYCQRRALLPQLVRRCQALRSNIVWASIRANPKPEVTPPRIETDSTIPFDWLTIPAGEFLMGSDNKQDQDAEATELPQHPIYLQEYRIARVPVTVAQFRRFVQAKDHTTIAENQGWAKDLIGTDWVQVKGASWRHPHGLNSDVQENHPVTCISWEDAVAFCAWAQVRLPTEAEWEKAASWDEANQTKRKWPWGNTFDPNKCNSREADIGDTTPVDMYSPRGDSAYGVSDMAGNAWEWCVDWYDPNYYKHSPRRNPQGPTSGQSRIARGGSWFQGYRYVRCANRFLHEPNATVSDWGFRVCAVEF